MKSASGNADTTPALRHPGRWLWLLLLVPVVLGLMRLRFDVEVFDLLPTDLPAVEGLKLYQEHFANARELVITLHASSAEQAETAAHNLAIELRNAPHLVEAVTWEPPWLEHPDQAAELIGYLWLNQPPDQFKALSQRLAPENLSSLLTESRDELATSMSPQEIGRLSYDPFGLTRLPEKTASAAPAFGQGQELFSSADGTFRVLFVQSSVELKTYRDCAKWLSEVKARAKRVVTELPNAPRIKLGYTGRPAFVAEIATGMEQDMTKSIGGTAAIIAVLFWLAHRRIKPMLWLLLLLFLILGSTLALGGLFFGTINVVSMGFAAILLGLAVDYAVVHYQEALAQPQLSIPQIRHAIAPSIFWAAVTTISAFLVLNFGGLPGLGQLGTLVGLGVALAALIMIFEFLPPLFPNRNTTSPTSASQTVDQSAPVSSGLATLAGRPWIAFPLSGIVLLFCAAVLSFGLPHIDPTAGPLRPRHSEAYAAVEDLQSLLNQKREPLWVIISGKSASQVADELELTETVLSRAQSNGTILSFSLPTALWPRPEYQNENRQTALELASEGPVFRKAALTNGFAEPSLALTEGILNTWRVAAQDPMPFWPTNPMSRWIFEKVSARTPTNLFTLGMGSPRPESSPAALTAALAEIQGSLPRGEAWISGWELLGSSIFSRVKANMWKVLVPMVGLVLLSLVLAFRRAPEILLSLAVLALSAMCVLSVMRLVGWSWNLLNLMALPLVLGTGVDYSIFMQLALRRHGGDLRAAYNSVGRALLLCGGTAIAGFGSLAWSTNAGMASLGQVCSVGIASNMLIAIFLLPAWWQRVVATHPRSPGEPPSKPSTLYRSRIWSLGLTLAKVLPRGAAIRLGGFLAALYWATARHRRAVVIQNLAPGSGDEVTARRMCKSLFQQFARKVVDLWRYEAGLDANNLLKRATGWKFFEEAQAQGRGILLLTTHLGNWEFGGPMLTQRGVKLLVLTMAEPDKAFTQLRQASRARWQVQTLVVGEDPLAFVEVIKSLEAGATVALLMDRPPTPTAVTVDLFGRPFQASISAAELARASGCALLPVYIVWEGDGYSAHILPAVSYERPELRDRCARQRLTQRIIQVFEPIIRAHLDQWYHFVPVWGESHPGAGSDPEQKRTFNKA